RPLGRVEPVDVVQCPPAGRSGHGGIPPRRCHRLREERPPRVSPAEAGGGTVSSMGGGGRVVDYPTALAAARRRFVATGALPMDALAGDLWISRATLYRVVGNRDRLLGDVLWRLAHATLRGVTRTARESGLVGVDRLLYLSRLFRTRVARFPPVQRFLHDDPADAVRILTTSAGGVHARMVAAWA